ncbi:MAG: HigA family addiction module antitoxin [Actinomycetes bacterium]
MNRTIMLPIHPGELLREEFLKPMAITEYRLAKAIGVPPRRINEITHEKRGISANTALRLARFFGLSDEYWMNAQMRYELETERDRIGELLDQIEPLAG